MMELGARASLPWASPPLVRTAMDFPAPERFSKNFLESCRVGSPAAAMPEPVRCHLPKDEIKRMEGKQLSESREVTAGRYWSRAAVGTALNTTDTPPRGSYTHGDAVTPPPSTRTHARTGGRAARFQQRFINLMSNLKKKKKECCNGKKGLLVQR